jgi:hypothetical protein
MSAVRRPLVLAMSPNLSQKLSCLVPGVQSSTVTEVFGGWKSFAFQTVPRAPRLYGAYRYFLEALNGTKLLLDRLTTVGERLIPGASETPVGETPP